MGCKVWKTKWSFTDKRRGWRKWHYLISPAYHSRQSPRSRTGAANPRSQPRSYWLEPSTQQQRYYFPFQNKSRLWDLHITIIETSRRGIRLVTGYHNRCPIIWTFNHLGRRKSPAYICRILTVALLASSCYHRKHKQMFDDSEGVLLWQAVKRTGGESCLYINHRYQISASAKPPARR